jgi:NADH-quinone oxidoreductase subunit K
MDAKICIICGLILFFVGFFALLYRKNIIFMMLGIEMMLNAANLVFAAGTQIYHNADGQIMIFFIMAIAACEAAVGLAMLIWLSRNRKIMDTDHLTLLRG